MLHIAHQLLHHWRVRETDIVLELLEQPYRPQLVLIHHDPKVVQPSPSQHWYLHPTAPGTQNQPGNSWALEEKNNSPFEEKAWRHQTMGVVLTWPIKSTGLARPATLQTPFLQTRWLIFSPESWWSRIPQTKESSTHSNQDLSPEEGY